MFIAEVFILVLMLKSQYKFNLFIAVAFCDSEWVMRWVMVILLIAQIWVWNTSINEYITEIFKEKLPAFQGTGWLLEFGSFIFNILFLNRGKWFWVWAEIPWIFFRVKRWEGAGWLKWLNPAQAGLCWWNREQLQPGCGQQWKGDCWNSHRARIF